jgi:hypothetical protein
VKAVITNQEVMQVLKATGRRLFALRRYRNMLDRLRMEKMGIKVVHHG